MTPPTSVWLDQAWNQQIHQWASWTVRVDSWMTPWVVDQKSPNQLSCVWKYRKLPLQMLKRQKLILLWVTSNNSLTGMIADTCWSTWTYNYNNIGDSNIMQQTELRIQTKFIHVTVIHAKTHYLKQDEYKIIITHL